MEAMEAIVNSPTGIASLRKNPKQRKHIQLEKSASVPLLQRNIAISAFHGLDYFAAFFALPIVSAARPQSAFCLLRS